MISSHCLPPPAAMHRPAMLHRFIVPHHFIVAVCVAIAALTAATAQAADKPKKEGSFGTAKPGGGYLTKEQLRGCLAQQARAAEQDAGLQPTRDALDANKAELVREGDALKARLESLDRTSADAVAAYNENASARDAKVERLQADIGSFNQRVEAAKTQREAFAKECSNRRFFEEDEIAIKQGK